MVDDDQTATCRLTHQSSSPVFFFAWHLRAMTSGADLRLPSVACWIGVILLDRQSVSYYHFLPQSWLLGNLWSRIWPVLKREHCWNSDDFVQVCVKYSKQVSRLEIWACYSLAKICSIPVLNINLETTWHFSVFLINFYLPWNGRE